MYSLSFPAAGLPATEFANVQANIAWLHLELGNSEQAEHFAAQASPNNLRGRYITFKTALDAKRYEDAISIVRSIGAESAQVNSELREALLCNAVQDAFDGKHRAVAVAALADLCSKDISHNDTHLMRCLVSLKKSVGDGTDEQNFRSSWKDLLHLSQLAAAKIEYQVK
jgi:hypothetical protein